MSWTPEKVSLVEDNVVEIGKALFAEYVIPFELTSVLLLVALVGAIILARGDALSQVKEGDRHE